MKDIARELGVSVVTVSKVIRNHSDIGEETRQRVLKRIKELNYEPNMAARALVTGRTYSAGLIVPDLVHPFFAEVAAGISDVLRRKNYSLLISSSQGDPDLERQEVKRLLSRRLDGQPADSVRQIHHGLHFPLAGSEVPGTGIRRHGSRRNAQFAAHGSQSAAAVAVFGSGDRRPAVFGVRVHHDAQWKLL